jgi:hypothetical protein
MVYINNVITEYQGLKKARANHITDRREPWLSRYNTVTKAVAKRTDDPITSYRGSNTLAATASMTVTNRDEHATHSPRNVTSRHEHKHNQSLAISNTK